MNKKWLVPAIASIALMASACGNNAAPNYTTPNQSSNTQSVRNYDGMQNGNTGMHNLSVDGLRARVNDGRGMNNNGGSGNTNGYRTSGTNKHVYMGPGGTGYNNFSAPRRSTTYTTPSNGFNGYNSYSNAGAGSFAGMGTASNNNYTGTGYGYNSYGTGYNGTRTNSYNNTNAFTNGNRPYNAYSDGQMGSNYSYNSGMRGHSIYQNGGNRFGMGTMSTSMPQLGYAQSAKSTTGHTAGVRNTNNSHQIYVDREALAQAISDVTSSCPGVQRSTVLVTDREVLVGLKTDGKNAREAKKQARMNAMSISPRYYKVHVTDNDAHIKEMSQLASRSSNFSIAGSNVNNPVRALVDRVTGRGNGSKMNSTGGNAKNNSKSPVGISSR